MFSMKWVALICTKMLLLYMQKQLFCSCMKLTRFYSET